MALVIFGEALLTRMVVLFGYAVLMGIGYHLFVKYDEEPTLERLFGEPYARYREAVPRWLPRWPAVQIAALNPVRDAVPEGSWLADAGRAGERPLRRRRA